MGVIDATFGLFTDIVLAVIGIIFCFFGYRAFKASITSAGIILGYELGNFICKWISVYTKKPMDSLYIIIVEVVLAIVLGALAFKFYKKAIVLISMLLVGGHIYEIIAANHPEKTTQTKDSLILFGICLVIGFAIGLLCLFIQKWMIIIITSIGGANILSILLARYLIGIKVVSEFTQMSISKVFKTAIAPDTALTGLLLIILCILGILAQKKNAKKL